MTKEFDLSGKECNILITKVEIDKINEITKMPLSYFSFERGFFKEDVKEFIRKVNEIVENDYITTKVKLEQIDKLAGEKLK